MEFLISKIDKLFADFCQKVANFVCGILLRSFQFCIPQNFFSNGEA